MSAPSQISEERVDRIVAALRRGATRKGAASCAGIRPSTLYEWIRRGKAGEQPYAAFWGRVQVEQRAWEVSALSKIHKAAEAGVWTAAAWLLERRLPKNYGRRLNDSAVKRQVEQRVALTELERNPAAMIVE